MELVVTTVADHAPALRAALAAVEGDYVRSRADRDRLAAAGVPVDDINERLDRLDKVHADMLAKVREAEASTEGPAAFRPDDAS